MTTKFLHFPLHKFRPNSGKFDTNGKNYNLKQIYGFFVGSVVRKGRPDSSCKNKSDVGVNFHEDLLLFFALLLLFPSSVVCLLFVRYKTILQEKSVNFKILVINLCVC